MNRAARTPPLPPREYSGNAKRSLRMALDLADVTVAQFAEALGEHEDTVSAWCSPSRCNQVPLWVLAHLATALLDQRIDAHEAEGLLPRVRALRASLQSFERHCVALLAGRPS